MQSGTAARTAIGVAACEAGQRRGIAIWVAGPGAAALKPAGFHPHIDPICAKFDGIGL